MEGCEEMDGYKLDEYIIQVSQDKKEVFAWTRHGAKAFKILPEEKDIFRFDPKRALQHMRHYTLKGLTRCYHCGKDITSYEIVDFTEPVCDVCHKNYKDNLKDEGNCRICGKPRSICCC